MDVINPEDFGVIISEESDIVGEKNMFLEFQNAEWMQHAPL
jgi:hypothetical protein